MVVGIRDHNIGNQLGFYIRSFQKSTGSGSGACLCREAKTVPGFGKLGFKVWGFHWDNGK